MTEMFDVVTGAFGYIGRYIAAELLASGRPVRTITTHVDRPSPFGDRVPVSPYNFDDPDALVQSLTGAETLYNTYWIRFNHGGQTFDKAVANTRVLFDCAVKAGVKKIVHISVTQTQPDDHLPYFAGKWTLENDLKGLGLPYAIVRPTLVFGVEDILVNNIGWLLRKFPFFPMFGDGQYRLQPIYAGDLAKVVVEAAGRPESASLDAFGPETLTFEALVKQIASAVGRQVPLVHVPAGLGIFLGRLLGFLVGDVILTDDEAKGLMEERLTSDQMPNGKILFSEWIRANGEKIGLGYTSELDKHFRWQGAGK